MLPDTFPVWRVELDPGEAAELRARVGSGQRAAVEEQDWGSEFGSPLPPGARLLRVEPDEPVGVFVEASWPVPDYGFRNGDLGRLLRAVEPSSPAREQPTSLESVAYLLRKAGALTDGPPEAA